MFFIGANMKSKLLTECLAVNLALFYSDTCSEFISIRSMPCLQKNEGGVQKGYKEYDDCYLGTMPMVLQVLLHPELLRLHHRYSHDGCQMINRPEPSNVPIMAYGHNLGTIIPLTFGITADCQWVCLFRYQFL